MWRELLIGRERALLALDQLERLLPDLTRDTVTLAIDARWNFARHMLAQLDRQDDQIRLVLLDDPPPATNDIVRAFVADRARLAVEFEAHARRYWLDETIAANAVGYRLSLTPLLQASRDLLRREKDVLHPIFAETHRETGPLAERRSNKWAADAGRYRSAAPAPPAPMQR